MRDISCIIIEDEIPAQEILKSFIARTEWVKLRSVCDDAVCGLEYLKKNDVDLVFLDIQMPTLSGIELLKVLKNPPQVIITSAFSEYAIEAFELDVRDYLMKPFSFDRFLKAIQRISPYPEVSQVHQYKSQPGTERSFAFFNVNKTMVKVLFDDILYIESMREYIYLHTRQGKVVTRISTSEIESLLGHDFVRIHRSFIVNLKNITAYNAEDIFIDKIALPIGVSYKKHIETLLKAHLF